MVSIFNYQSAREFLAATLKAKVTSNSQFSLRAFARHLGVSPTTLSNYLAYKSSLSAESMIKIARKLRMDAYENHYFFAVLVREKLADLQAIALVDRRMNEIVQERNQNNAKEVFDNYFYFIPGHPSIRTLSRRMNSQTGALLKEFDSHFYSIEFGICASAKFRSRDGQNNVISIDSNFFTDVHADLDANYENQCMVGFDRGGFPNLSRLPVTAKKDTSLKYVDISFGRKELVIVQKQSSGAPISILGLSNLVYSVW